MAPSPAIRPHTAARRRRLAMVVTCLLIGWRTVGHPSAQAQAPHADANQLHEAIVNGDVESLRYWLTVRHADVSAANAAEPDVTPLERCLGLAARVLDAPPDANRESTERSSPSVGLRTLQSLVTLLHDHGAQVAEVDRRRFSGPVTPMVRRRGVASIGAGRDRARLAAARASYSTGGRPGEPAGLQLGAQARLHHDELA